MIEKLGKVLDYLRAEKGWQVKAIWADGRWSILVEFIQCGLWYGYSVSLDNGILKWPAASIGEYVAEQALGAMEER